jgi:uncharacterized protein (DUF433 family)
MDLEKYFEFINNESIRVAGTRVGIETILRDYRRGASPEEIVLHYPTLSLEQVHATITFYLASRERVDNYLQKTKQRDEEAWREQQRQPSEFLIALRKRLDRRRRELRPEETGTSTPVGK